MKKIGLLTMSCIPNYGAMLQTYATYISFNKTIRHLGHRELVLEVINYEPMVQKKRYSAKALTQSIVHGKEYRNRFHDILNLIKIRHSEALKLHKLSASFKAKYLNTSGNEYDFNDYDAYVVGSDQTWNPGLMEDDTFLLDFTDSKYKYSYASSIGVEKLSKDEANKFQRYLSSFQYISLREDVGCEIISKLMPDKMITQVLDPTLLLNRDDWTTIEADISGLSSDYIFVYLAKKSDAILLFARNLSEKTGYRLIITSTPDTYKDLNEKEYIGMIRPEEFIMYVHYAKCIVTNSFHGIAFSINFGKDFYTAYNSLTVTKTNSRIGSILRMFQLENRLIREGRTSYRPIDWESVNSVLETWRDRSFSYISSIIKDVEERQ